uniref:VWFC domain-containing protein n=1 Tax=Knipowitschia caucasica TaxID=637954 RepID=A0AAV2MQP4_KNICA
MVLCTNTVCPNPQCDFQKGERLRIPANKCCPECISSQGSCQSEGVTYGEGSVWQPSPCQRCLCSGQSVSCSPLSCPALNCPADHTEHTIEGECCPQCVRNGGSCRWEDREYRDGEQFESGLCSRCVCSDGEIQCSVAECPSVSCKTNENLVIRTGQCCPECVTNPCLSAGKQYQVCALFHHTLHL